jgi:hypothetical protein
MSSSSSLLPASSNSDPQGGVDVASCCAACGCHCRTAHFSPTPDPLSMLGPLVESLHADLKDFFMSRIEEMARSGSGWHRRQAT